MFVHPVNKFISLLGSWPSLELGFLPSPEIYFFFHISVKSIQILKVILQPGH